MMSEADKILITGAGGKTGMAVCEALIEKGATIRAWVRQEAYTLPLRKLGVEDFIVGDLLDTSLAERAMRGIRAVYHIPPNMNPDELRIAENLIYAAQSREVMRFVYHSVLHPQVEEMPHHWQKMRVEERLFASGLAFTILQPAVYMQNLLGYWPSIQRDGIYAVPYSIDAPLSQVHLGDVAEAVAKVLVEESHAYAIYELCGAEALSAREAAQRLSQHLGKPVEAVEVDRDEWQRKMLAGGMSEYAVNTLLKMFLYYEKYGMRGNPNVLRMLLGRNPTIFDEFLAMEIQ
uniref:NAD-dependent epimerase/dehydratase family protein n=1 Tax=Bellilinea caldifistulae TaxID=360411 RepID=A0A7C4Q535_9CHLR